MRHLALAAALAAAAATATAQAADETYCGESENFMLALAVLGQSAAFVGSTADGGAVGVTLNSRTGAWTLVLTRNDGTSCALATGEGGARYANGSVLVETE